MRNLLSAEIYRYKHSRLFWLLLCAAVLSGAFYGITAFDGCFDDMFVVGLETPAGMTSYHYEMKFWDLFKVKEIPNAPEWDGYTPEDVLGRLQSLN